MQAQQIKIELLKCMEEVAAQTGSELATDLNAHSTLIESGLDSLAMALVIAKMDERIGVRPFQSPALEGMPVTLNELVFAYHQSFQNI